MTSRDAPPVESRTIDQVIDEVRRRANISRNDALGEVQRVRAARKLDAVRIQVDPPTL